MGSQPSPRLLTRAALRHRSHPSPRASPRASPRYLLRHGLQPAEPVLRLLQHRGEAQILVLELQSRLHNLLQVGAAEAVHVLVQVGAGRLPQHVGQGHAAGRDVVSAAPGSLTLAGGFSFYFFPSFSASLQRRNKALKMHLGSTAMLRARTSLEGATWSLAEPCTSPCTLRGHFNRN